MCVFFLNSTKLLCLVFVFRFCQCQNISPLVKILVFLAWRQLILALEESNNAMYYQPYYMSYWTAFDNLSESSRWTSPSTKCLRWKILCSSLKPMQSFYSLSWHEEWREEVGQRVFWQKFGQKKSWDVSSFYLDRLLPALNNLVIQPDSQSVSQPVGKAAIGFTFCLSVD